MSILQTAVDSLVSCVADKTQFLYHFFGPEELENAFEVPVIYVFFGGDDGVAFCFCFFFLFFFAGVAFV